MRRIALLFFILSYSTSSLTQSPYTKIDKLKTDLRLTTDPNQKGQICIDIAIIYHDINPDSVYHYADRAAHFGMLSNNVSIEASGMHNKAVGLRKKGELKKALDLFYRSLKLREKTKEYDKISSSYLSIGNIFHDQGLLAEEKEQFDSADEKYAECLKYYQKGLRFAKKSGDSIQVSKSYQNIGSAYYNTYNSASNSYEYEKAIEHYDLSYNSYPVAEREWVYAELKSGILACKIELKEPLNNLYQEYLDILHYVKRNNQKEQWINLNTVYSAALWKSQPKKAMQVLIEADSVARQLNNTVARIKTNQSLYRLSKDQGNYEDALYYFEIYSALDAELSNAKTKSKIEELNIQYKTEKKERRIVEEQAKSKAAQSDKDFFRGSLIAALVLLVVIVGFFLQRQYISRLRRKREKEAYDNKVNSLLLNQELKSIEAMLDGQETERKRIAEDLHDRLGSTLSAAKMYFEATIDRDQNTKTEQQSKAYELLDKAIQDTREISHNLVSGALSKFGLFVALRDLKDTIEGASDVQVTIDIDATDERFHSEVEIQVYRIIQELFSNSLKHADPKHLSVRLVQKKAEVSIFISDDGKGYTVNEVSSGMGLKNIKGRISKLGGTHHVTSDKTSGTINTITFNLTNID